MDEFAFQRALAAIWDFIGVVEPIRGRTEPWKLAKDPAPTWASEIDRMLLYARRSRLRCLGIAPGAHSCPRLRRRSVARSGQTGEP